MSFHGPAVNDPPVLVIVAVIKDGKAVYSRTGVNGMFELTPEQQLDRGLRHVRRVMEQHPGEGEPIEVFSKRFEPNGQDGH